MQKNLNKLIYILGDVHGNFKALLHNIEEKDLKDCYLICVGDLGIGFQYSYQGEIFACERLSQIFKKRNIQFLSIRGNHDDPKFFKGKDRIVYPNFELLEDYTVKKINGETFLFVGGAVSIDKKVRNKGTSWWSDEVFVLDESKIVPCDVLITHSAPAWLGPFDKGGLINWIKNDPSLWDECVKERLDHNVLLQKATPKRHFCGHFHIWAAVDFGGCYSRILDELEILEYKHDSTTL